MKKIPLTNSDEFAIVDNEDFKKVSRRKWYSSNNGRIKSTDTPQIYLHHFVSGKPPEGMETDHRNGNGFDNRRQNLRFATSQQNKRNMGRRCNNTSGFKGVYWYEQRKKWRVRLGTNGGQRHLGYFSDPVEAARAYDVAAKKLFGEFAKPNFPMRFPRTKTS